MRMHEWSRQIINGSVIIVILLRCGRERSSL
jgi:hypothetical protein